MDFKILVGRKELLLKNLDRLCNRCEPCLQGATIRYHYLISIPWFNESAVSQFLLTRSPRYLTQWWSICRGAVSPTASKMQSLFAIKDGNSLIHLSIHLFIHSLININVSPVLHGQRRPHLHQRLQHVVKGPAPQLDRDDVLMGTENITFLTIFN